MSRWEKNFVFSGEKLGFWAPLRECFCMWMEKMNKKIKKKKKQWDRKKKLRTYCFQKSKFNNFSCVLLVLRNKWLLLLWRIGIQFIFLWRLNCHHFFCLSQNRKFYFFVRKNKLKILSSNWRCAEAEEANVWRFRQIAFERKKLNATEL